MARRRKKPQNTYNGYDVSGGFAPGARRLVKSTYEIQSEIAQKGTTSDKPGVRNEMGMVVPTLTLDPATGRVVPQGGTIPPPIPTGGAGRVDAATSLPQPPQPTLPSQPTMDPVSVSGLDGRTVQDVMEAPEDQNILQTGFKNTTHWLSNLFNPDDESDLHIAGINLSGVESVFDAAMTGLGMASDTANWALSGAFLAANPHYWANRDQGIEGNLWQDATRVSAGRAFQGMVSPLQDVLGEVITGEQQGIYSVQQDVFGTGNFDIAEENERVFAEQQSKRTLNLGIGTMDFTPGEWGSGIGDVLVAAYADPLNLAGFGVGKAAKFGRLRYLNKPILTADDTARVVNNLDDAHLLLDDLTQTVNPNGAVVTRRIEDLTPDEVAGVQMSDEARFAWEVSARQETKAAQARRAEIEQIADPAQRQAALDEFDTSPDFFMQDGKIVSKYEKRMNDSVIYEHDVIKNATNRDALTAALHNSRSFDEAALILRHAVNDRTASAALNQMAPDLYLGIINGERELVTRMLAANPQIVGKEIARWQARTDELAKRLDDLDDLRADPAVIADIRAQLDDAMDMWQHAQDGYMAPVGTGPTATADEVDLLRRAIDKQLEGNELFLRALQDAGGNPNANLAGSLFGESSKGFIGDGGASWLPGSLGRASEQASEALLAGVSKSRQTRAARRALAAGRQGRLGAELRQAEGISGKAGALARGFANNWKVDEVYGVRPMNLVTASSIVGIPVARVFRWMPVERQGFVIHTSGIGAQESAREIRAMLNGVDIYSGQARTIVVNGVEKQVGGLAAKERMIQQYQNAMLVGGDKGDMIARRLIDEVEEQMLNDIADWNGIDPKLLREVHYRQNRKLEKIEKEIREEGYWTDEKGSRNYAPYLESQLQNGSFLKNWRRINSVAQQFALREQAKMAGAGAKVKGQYVGGATIRLTGRTLDDLNSAMQEFWRPMVLLRLGYTQRNVAEGLFRSMAFAIGNVGSESSLRSLAASFYRPWTDAARQIGLSTSNVARKAAGANRRAAAVTEAAESGAALSDMPRAFQRWHDVQVTAAERNIATTRSAVFDARDRLAQMSPDYRTRRVADLNNKYAHVLEQQRQTRAALDEIADQRATILAREAELNQRVANGRTLGAKAQQELDDIPDRLNALARLEAESNTLLARNTDRLVDYGDEIDILSRMQGGTTTIDGSMESLMRDLDHLEDLDIPFQQAVRDSLDDMQAAATAYRRQAAPKSRTYGRTSSVGDPDSIASIVRQKVGEDPFAPSDTFGDIAWQNMSADQTMKQTAAMRMKAVGDAMTLQEMRYYVAVNPGDANYFDGVATVINQFQNSEIGKLAIAGRAAGKGDAEIIDDIVRFLYEDGRGQEIAAFVNQANDIMFGGSFESARVRSASAMRQAVEDAAPLQDELDNLRLELRQAQYDSTSVRMQQPRPRWQGDAAPTAPRRWSGDSFGDFDVATQGRGQWTVTHARTGNVVQVGSRGEARRQARALQAQDDAYWQVGPFTTKSGKTFASYTEAQDAVAALRTQVDEAASKLEDFITTHSAPKPRQGADARRLNTSELDDARLYAEEVLRRYDIVTAGDESLQGYLAANPQLPIGGGRHKATDAGQVIRGFLDGRDDLQPVIGNMAVFVGEASAMDIWRKGVAASFRAIGTIPEDLFVRSQFYGRAFNEHAQRMLDNIVGQVGEEGLTLHDVNVIRNQAHRRALKDTKDTLYTIDRRTNLGDTMERLVPFISASQNSVTAVGRLAWRDPSVIWAMAAIWTLPDRLLPDKDDNADTIAIPIGFIPKDVRDALGVGEEFVANKRSLDLLFNGVFDPQGPPLVGVASSELMKSGLFGVTPDTPDWLRSIPNGDVLWGYWKDYSLGKDAGASEYFASIDRVLAPWQKRMFDAFIMGPGSSASFGRVYQSYALLEAVKYRNGERDTEPTHDEVLGKARAAMGLRALANLSLFTTPKYDEIAAFDPAAMTLANEIRQHDDLYYEDQQRIKILKAQGVTDPQQLERQVISAEEQYGDLIVQAAYALQGTRENAAGVKISDYGVRKAKENADVIREIAPMLESTDSLEAIGILTEDTSEWYNGTERQRTPVADSPEWSQDAAAYFAAQKIPGTNETYRAAEAPEAASLRASNRVAWRKYMIGIEAIKLDMAKYGVKSFESKEGYLYKRLKNELIEGIDREHRGWGAEFVEQQASRTNAAIRVLTTAFNNPAFVARNADDPFWSKSGPAFSYLSARTAYIENVKAIKADAAAHGHVSIRAGNGASAPWAAAIEAQRAQWTATQAELGKSPTWAAIADRWIGEDDDPKNLMSDMYLDEEAS